MADTQLGEKMRDVGAKTEVELAHFFDRKIADSQAVDKELVAMARILREFTLRGGKRVRAFLVWCGYMIAGGVEEKKIIKVGAAVDMFHHFLLGVDDVADRDLLRHGGHTLEVVYRRLLAHAKSPDRLHYARSFTEIANILLHTYVFELLSLSGFSPVDILAAMRLLNFTITEKTIAGWKIHMVQNWQKLSQAHMDRFLKGLQLVSAEYTFVGPLRMGAELAHAPQKTLDALEEYGREVGTAYQLHDDVLGLFGNPKETGKAVGNDVREGKKTVLLQVAYERANAKDRAFLEKVTGTALTATQLKRVQAIVEQTGALKYSQQLAQKHVERGIQVLEKLEAQNDVSVYLQQLAIYVISREK